ncbi:hypothetical protein TNCV_232761 [Trichonephila clavipes]|nr:hypothetical protein TNCV_232761 [Trichonephila clavipes]
MLGSPVFSESRSKSQAGRRVVSIGSQIEPQYSKRRYSLIHWQMYCPKNQESWKVMGNPGYCGSYPEAPGESQGHCPLSPNHRT